MTMPNDSSIVLACGGDNNFAMPMTVMLFSALTNLQAGIAVHLLILDNGFSKESKANLERVLRQDTMPPRKLTIEYQKPDMSALGDLATTEWLNANAYLRLTIPQFLPKDCKKVLYLDGDMIVECDIALLWQQSLGENYVLAVQDYGIGYVASPLGLVETYQKVGLAPDTPYFNSGMMLINLERWRQEDIVGKVLNYTTLYKEHVQYADQDGLNAVIAGQWGQLDLRWNAQVGAIRAFEAWPDSPHKETMRPVVSSLIESAYILHFTGGRKPWIGGLTNPVRPRFDTYLKRSNWFATPQQYKEWRRRWLGHSLKLITRDVKKRLKVS